MGKIPLDIILWTFLQCAVKEKESGRLRIEVSKPFPREASNFVPLVIPSLGTL